VGQNVEERGGTVWGPGTRREGGLLASSRVCYPGECLLNEWKEKRRKKDSGLTHRNQKGPRD